MACPHVPLHLGAFGVLRPRGKLAANGAGGRRRVRGQDPVHLHGAYQVVRSARLSSLAPGRRPRAAVETSCPTFPSHPTSISFALRRENCFVPQPTANPLPSPAFVRSRTA